MAAAGRGTSCADGIGRRDNGVRGLGKNFAASPAGTVSVMIEQERIRWEPDQQGNAYWLRLARPADEVSEEIENLMVCRPQTGAGK